MNKTNKIIWWIIGVIVVIGFVWWGVSRNNGSPNVISNPASSPVTLSISPSPVRFAVQQGVAPTSSQVLSVTLSSGTTGLIHSNISYSSGDNWLTVGNSMGSTPGSIVVSALPTGLLPGSYAATIVVSESGLTTSVPVTLIISPLGK